MADLARLVVRLEAESLKFQKELDQAKRKLAGFDSSASKSAANIGKVLGGAAIAAGTALAFMAKNAIDVADETSKASQKIGITTEALSQLRFAADLAGVSTSSLDKAMLKLNRSISDAATSGTGKAANAFKALGIAVEDGNGAVRDSDAVLGELAGEFAGMQDGATKTALAMDLFGKSGAEMIPLLNGGAQALAEARKEADALGQTIDGKAAKAAEQFNDNLSRLSKSLGGAMLQATQEVTPVLAILSDELVKASKDGELMKTTSAVLAGGLRLLVSTAVIVTGAFYAFGRSIQGVAQAAAELDLSSLAKEFTLPGQFLQFIGVLEDETEATTRAWEKLKKSQEDVTAATAKENALLENLWSENTQNAEQSAEATGKSNKKITDAMKSLGSEAKKSANEQASAMGTIKGMVQDLQQQADTYEQGEGAVIRYRIAQGDLAATFATAGAGAQQYKDRLVALTDQLEQQRATTEATAKHQQVFDDVMAQGRATTEATRTPLEQYESTIADLGSQLSIGAITQDTYNRAVKAAGDSFDEAALKSDEWATATKSAFENAAKNMQSSLADFLFDPFADGLDGMLNGFVTMLRRMGAELLAAEAFKMLGASVGGLGGGGGGGGIIAGIAGLFGGARANGGPVSGGTPYLVGERGPELMVPGSSGNVMNARETAGMGGGANITMNVMTPNADSFRKSSRQVVNGVKIGFGV